MGNTGTNTFPSSLPFVTRQPHHSLITVLSHPSPQPAVRDLENLFGDATFRDETTAQTDIESSQWSVPTGVNGLPVTYQHEPSTSTPSPASTSLEDDDLGSLYQGLPKNAKIGIIVGIVVIVSLTLLGCSMCFLDFRRRQRKRNERRENRNAEPTMLEMEIRHRQVKTQRETRRGLWDHLKPGSGTGDNTIMGTKPGNAQDVVKQNSAVESTRNGSVAGSLRTHISKDGASIVSSVPSLTSSTGGRPALPRNFLDSGVRR